MSSQSIGLTWIATAEVTRPEYAEECLGDHPGEPCPGYPHDTAPEG